MTRRNSRNTVAVGGCSRCLPKLHCLQWLCCQVLLLLSFYYAQHIGFVKCCVCFVCYYVLLLQVRIWDVKTQTCLVTLSGHSGAVTALRFSRDGGLLASGSADTTLVVWDVVAEAGLCRFKGHKDAITDVVSNGRCVGLAGG